MHEFRIKPLIETIDVLVNCSGMIHSHHPRIHPRVGDAARNDIRKYVEDIIPQLEQSELSMCRKAAERLLDVVKTSDVSDMIVSCIDDFRRRILDQADSTFCLLLSDQEKRLFEQATPFGPEVEKKFSVMSEDIAEAAKCIAVGRPTAGVFHLMRVMENGVRYFGDELGVQLVDEKNWQNILDEINKKIKVLDHKQQKTKALAEAASHLYNVKVAWRNETMHPKQTYSPEEATAIFGNTRTFICDLATLI